MTTTTQQTMDTYLTEKIHTGQINTRTARQLRYQLYAFAEVATTDPAKLTKRDVVRWLHASGHLAANSRRQYFNRIRNFTAWLQRQEILGHDPFRDVPAPKVPRSVHRSLMGDQVAQLLAACATPRERVIVVLGLSVGLRRAEMAGVEVGDIDLAARTLFVRCGKGGHERLLPMPTSTARMIGQYIANEALSSGPLIRSLLDPQAGIGAETVGIIFARLAYRSGVKRRARDGVGAHSLRHSFASSLYEATSDVLIVRDLLGHVSLGTTEVYVRGFGMERLRAAVEALPHAA